MYLKQELIKLLADGKFHSGEELGQQLQVSRSAIWKCIKELANFGIEVHSISGKGYRIPEGLQLLDLPKIRSYLSATLLSQTNIEILWTIHSTNQYLLENQAYKPPGTIVLAEHQSSGRGRRQRPWLSPFGTNLYFSIAWRFEKDPSELAGLSLAAGVAVANALERYGLSKIRLKWPNDILCNYKKISGILIEMTAETHTTTQVVIGIGLNTQMPRFLMNNQDWTDVMSIIHQPPDRNRIAALLIEEILEMLFAFQLKGFSPFYKPWLALDAFYDKPISLSTSTETYYGIGQGINRHGEYLLLNEEKKQLRFLNGEVSLRPLNGAVTLQRIS